MREEIQVNKFSSQIFKQWDSDWFLLSCGDYSEKKFNTMTVAWGGFGIMWNLPIAMVVVRPSRFTYGFLNDFETFTLCGFPPQYKKALSMLGTKSGRDGNKIAESGLTPAPSDVVSAPVFEEASLAISCRKIYFSDFLPEQFLDPRIEKQYGGEDYHRMVFGEILKIESDLS